MQQNCHNVSKVFSCLQVKHDDEDCRVMYREGLKGSPFHTLLVEGCIDGTIEDCKYSQEFEPQEKVFDLILTVFIQVYVYAGNHHCMRNGESFFSFMKMSLVCEIFRFFV